MNSRSEPFRYTKKEYLKGTLRDWKKVVEKYGIEGLLKPGGIQFDRGPNNTDKDKLKRLELQAKYLEAENDFLAILRAKRAESNSGRVKNTGSSERKRRMRQLCANSRTHPEA